MQDQRKFKVFLRAELDWFHQPGPSFAESTAVCVAVNCSKFEGNGSVVCWVVCFLTLNQVCT